MRRSAGEVERWRPRVPDLGVVWTVIADHQLALWFVLVDQIYVGAYVVARIATLGSDATLYVAATHAWLSGSDPWLVAESGIRFAAPPPTLLLYVPFAFMPAGVAAAFWLLADILAIIYVIRRLKLAWWWALFPPIVESGLAGNPEPVVLALLVSSSTAFSAVAPLLKAYAIAPLLGERRWRPIAFSGVLVALTALILPWSQFIADAPTVTTTLANQTVGLSAFSVPWLTPVAALGLLGLGVRRAGWLVVPTLWPHTQLHYATTAIPVMTPILAFGLSLPVPGAPALAVAAQALHEVLRRRSLTVTHGASVR